MSVKLIRTLTKKTEENWSGVSMDVSTSQNSTPDARDNVSSSMELSTKNVKDIIRSFPGYIGWDREYVGDNQLDVIYYFETFDNAMSMFKYRTNIWAKTDPNIPKMNYDISWKFITESGEVITAAE